MRCRRIPAPAPRMKGPIRAWAWVRCGTDICRPAAAYRVHSPAFPETCGSRPPARRSRCCPAAGAAARWRHGSRYRCHRGCACRILQKMPVQQEYLRQGSCTARYRASGLPAPPGNAAAAPKAAAAAPKRKTGAPAGASGPGGMPAPQTPDGTAPHC